MCNMYRFLWSKKKGWHHRRWKLQRSWLDLWLSEDDLIDVTPDEIKNVNLKKSWCERMWVRCDNKYSYQFILKHVHILVIINDYNSFELKCFWIEHDITWRKTDANCTCCTKVGQNSTTELMISLVIHRDRESMLCSSIYGLIYLGTNACLCADRNSDALRLGYLRWKPI